MSPSILVRLMQGSDGSDIWPSFYFKLQSQLSRPYAAAPKGFSMTRGERSKLMRTLFSVTHWVDNASLTFNDIHNFIDRSQEIFHFSISGSKRSTERAFLHGNGLQENSPTGSHGPANTSSYYKKSSATIRMPITIQVPFQALPSLLFRSPRSLRRTLRPFC